MKSPYVNMEHIFNISDNCLIHNILICLPLSHNFSTVCVSIFVKKDEAIPVTCREGL
jgi:hypothetical protein